MMNLAKPVDASQESSDFFAHYECLSVQKMRFVVPPAMAQGYRSACEAYHRMEQETENGPYQFLSGYEYAYLARQHYPEGLTAAEKHEWQGGFIAGWTACMFMLDEPDPLGEGDEGYRCPLLTRERQAGEMRATC